MKQLFILFLLYSTIGFGQIDSLKNKSYEELTSMIVEYATIDSEIALNMSQYYVDKARLEKEIEKEWKGTIILANINFNEGNFYRTAQYEKELLQLINDPQLEKFRFKTFMAIGDYNLREGVLRRSLEFYNKAKDVAEESQNIEDIQRSYNMINLIKAMGGDYKSAIATAHSLRHRVISMDSTKMSKNEKLKMLFSVDRSIADTYIKAKNVDSAYFYANQALQYGLKSQQDSCKIQALYRQLSRAQILKKEYNQANKSVETALKFCKITSKYDSLLVGILKGKIYLGQGRYKESIAALENGINTYGVSKTEEGFMDDTYFDLATAYKEDGNIEKAGYYLSKHVNSKEKYSLIKDTIQTSIRNREIETFKAELEQLELEKKQKQSYLNYLLLGGSIVILLLLFFLLKFYRNKKADEAKFEALIAKIKDANIPSEIIDTKDEVLEEKTTDVSEEVTQQILDGLKKLEEKKYFLNRL